MVLFPPYIHLKVASIMFLRTPEIPLFKEKKLVRVSLSHHRMLVEIEGYSIKVL